MDQEQTDQELPLVDPCILKDKRVMLVRDLDSETVLVGMKPCLVAHYTIVNDIDAEPNCGKKTGLLLDFLQRYSVKEYKKFNMFLKVVAGAQPALFSKLVGREPSRAEADFSVQRYAESLKECIKGQGHTVDSPLDEQIEFDSEHVQLAIVRDKPEQETFDDLPHRYQSHLSEVEERKDYVPAVEVLSSHNGGNKPKHVSLYGRAGTGKTTTFQWLAREWSFNRWAVEFTLVFLLQVRMLSVLNFPITAIELLTLHSLYQVQDADLVCLVSSWLKHSGTKMLIMLDGLDEISGFSNLVRNCRKIVSLNEKAHPIDICINILLGNLLPGATVLTASRQFAGLNSVQFDKQFEILGLTELRVSKFVQKKHPTKAAQIMAVLSENPLLMSVSGITFYCVLISRLIAEDVEFDNEELQTYTRLTAFIVVQYVSRKLSDWPFVVEVMSYFQELSRLAYNGIYDTQLNGRVSKLVFDHYDLARAKMVPQRLNAAVEAGLLQTEKVKVGQRSSVIAEFIHLSVQEMLASAYCLSQGTLPDNMFSHLFSNGQFNMTLLYLFGVKYDNGSSWIKDIKYSVNPSGSDLSPQAEDQMDSFIQGLCEQCYGLDADQNGSELQLCQLLHEGQMEDKAKGVAKYVVHKGGLAMAYTQLTLIDVMSVWFVSKHAEPITEISFYKCGLTETVVRFMTSSLLKDNVEKLAVLSLYYDNIGSGGAEAVAAWLKHNHTLHTLNLKSNSIGDSGTTALAAALHTNTSLHTLYVIDNNIGDTGATALAAALHTNTSLYELFVGGNNIGETGASALAAALHTNTSLHILNLYGNSINDSGASALATALHTNTSLHVLTVGYNNIGDTGAAALATVLDNTSSLQSLNVDNNYIGDIGVAALASALHTNTSLRTLNAYGNNLSAKGTAAVTVAQQKNSKCKVST